MATVGLNQVLGPTNKLAIFFSLNSFWKFLIRKILTEQQQQQQSIILLSENKEIQQQISVLIGYFVLDSMRQRVLLLVCSWFTFALCTFSGCPPNNLAQVPFSLCSVWCLLSSMSPRPGPWSLVPGALHTHTHTYIHFHQTQLLAALQTHHPASRLHGFVPPVLEFINLYFKVKLLYDLQFKALASSVFSIAMLGIAYLTLLIILSFNLWGLGMVGRTVSTSCHYLAEEKGTTMNI